MASWPSEPNWSAFYQTLQFLGPLMPTGVPKGARQEVIRMSEEDVGGKR